MQTLAFGDIMERNENWFEDYDLTCPFCKGKGNITKVRLECSCAACEHKWVTDYMTVGQSTDELDTPNENDIAEHLMLKLECPKCKSNETIEHLPNTEEESCEECGGTGQFEVMWNTAFRVHIRPDAIKEYQRFAWSEGYCLIAHDDEVYMLMGSCGQDNTWRTHYTRWKVQKHMSQEDINDCLSSGGYVFLAPLKQLAMLEYFRQEIPREETWLKELHKYFKKGRSKYPKNIRTLLKRVGDSLKYATEAKIDERVKYAKEEMVKDEKRMMEFRLRKAAEIKLNPDELAKG